MYVYWFMVFIAVEKQLVSVNYKNRRHYLQSSSFIYFSRIPLRIVLREKLYFSPFSLTQFLKLKP